MAIKENPEKGKNLSVAEAKERSEGLCEIRVSKDCTGKGTQIHHRKLRKQGGTDKTDNLLHTCDFCHVAIHLNPAQSYEHGWLVESWNDPEKVKVVNYVRNGKLCPKCHGTGLESEHHPKVVEKPRHRETWSMKIPKDERENGMELWEDVIERTREKATPLLGLKENAPAYYFLLPVLEDWLNES